MKKNKKIKIGIIVTIILIILSGLGTIGVKKMTEPSTKEKQISFIKEHENEMTEQIKRTNSRSEISYIEYDLDTFSVENSGAFTPELYSIHINLYDRNHDKIDGGSLSIIPDDINKPNKIIEISSNNFDKEMGEQSNGKSR